MKKIFVIGVLVLVFVLGIAIAVSASSGNASVAPPVGDTVVATIGCGVLANNNAVVSEAPSGEFRVTWNKVFGGGTKTTTLLYGDVVVCGRYGNYWINQ